MEPPSKRLKRDSSSDDEENQDELSMTPAQFTASQDPLHRFEKGRIKAATRYKSTLEEIFEKYGQDVGGEGDDDDDADDLINWYDDEIEVNNGNVLTMDARLTESLSSDEGETILSGKSGRRRKRPKSELKSLIPASHAKNKLDSGLETCRLSSLAYSPSPYDAHPCSDFELSPFRNGPIDPTWVAPDLPVQPQCQLNTLDASPRHVTTRLVSAKSLLITTFSDVEEDDILLGGYRPNKLPITRSPASKTHISVTSCAGTTQPSQSNSQQQPPFCGIDPVEDVLQTQPNDVTKDSIDDKIMEPLVPETLSPSHQPVEENTQLYQTAGDSRCTSPSHPKRGRPKKSDAREPSMFDKEEPKSETRLLQPHERRIEIIIPLMERLFPAETMAEQVAGETTPIADENPQAQYIGQEISIDEGRDAQYSQHTTPTIARHGSLVFHQLAPNSAEGLRDANVEHAAQTSEGPMNTSRPFVLSDPQPKRTPEQTELPIPKMSLYSEQGLENIGVEASQDPLSSKTVVDNSTDESPAGGLHQIEPQSSCESKTDRTAVYQQHFPITNISINEEHPAHASSEQGVETTLIEEQNPDVTFHPSPPLTPRSHEGAAGITIETSDPTTTDAVVSESISRDHENEDLPWDELDSKSVDSCGEQLLPVNVHALINEAPHHDQQSDEELGTSEILTSHAARYSTPEQGIQSREIEYPAIDETTESDPHPGKECLSPIFDLPRTSEGHEHGASDQPLLSNALIAGIDDLQLGSEPQDTERSPSPRTTELPDHDLSAFPAEPDAHFTSELALGLPSRKNHTSARRDTSIGRSPSPELGTPIRHKNIYEATSRIDDSPTPTTPTRRRGATGAKPRSSTRRSPSSKRFPLSSLVPGGIDDESDDELSIADSFSSTISRFHSPFSRTKTNDNVELPPLFSTPRKTTRKSGLLTGSASSARTPNRILGLNRDANMPPATDARVGRSQTRRRQKDRAVHSSPLARTVAERLLSSPTKRHRTTSRRPPSLVASPHGTLRRCGEDGFVCERDFCLTCCK